MKNPLYGDQDKWDVLTLEERVEFIRKHLCTGPCGQSSQVMQQRSRIGYTLHSVIKELRRMQLVMDENDVG